MKEINESYKILCECAEEKINAIMNMKNEVIIQTCFYALLMGVGLYIVEKYRGAGHNQQAVIDGFYNYYKHHPESNIKELLDKAMELYIEVATKENNLLVTLFSYFSYILNKQKKNEATFSLDVQKYLNQTKNGIIANKENLIKENPNINNWLDKENKYFIEKHNHHL